MAAILWTTLALVLLLAEARITDDNELKNQTYQWKTGNWGSCYAPGGCGEGRRQRQVRCTDGDGRTVLQYLCEVQKTPTHSKSCFTACRHHKDKLQWQPGEWGPCLPVAAGGISSSPLDPDRESLGVKQRNVTCVLVAHDSNKVHRPVDEDNCFTVARKPDPVRFCRLPRPQDCVTSQFSEWSSCDHCGEGGHPSNQTRVRTVLVAPMFGGKPCPQLTEMRPCWPRPDCARRVDGGDQPEYKLKVGEWRRCEAPSAVVSADSLEAGVVAHIAGESAGPDLHTSRWDDAERRLTFQPQVGYRTREASCRDARGTRVDISLCLGESAGSVMPASTQPCVVPQDCVVNQWSAWALVQEGCVAANGKVRPEVHERKREVVRLQQGEGQPCPHLAEKRQVSDKDQLQLCSHRYRRLASKWSPCVVTSDQPAGPRLLEVGCGGGVQLRDVTCVSVDSGQPVLEELCESLEPLPTVQRCEVACPRDCEVGPWSSWGPCKPVDCPEYSDTMLPATSTHAASWTAVTGYRERRRSIQVMSSEEGVDCPSTKEVQPCPQPTCYSWVQGLWSSCYLDPGAKRCGEGRRTRLVTCRSTLYGVSSFRIC
ncbi:thrombospondin type-1 domain-containing protein 7B-like [Bacillus rossius redtenbacheri]|uniref:thrombospondin type-1 domain-containing protein 7B-like n=1 Tax=Bacillus rossius redtenbacheri TaxID=93214 RepID=UPI002FDEECDC